MKIDMMPMVESSISDRLGKEVKLAGVELSLDVIARPVDTSGRSLTLDVTIDAYMSPSAQCRAMESLQDAGLSELDAARVVKAVRDFMEAV